MKLANEIQKIVNICNIRMTSYSLVDFNFQHINDSNTLIKIKIIYLKFNVTLKLKT